MNLIAICIIIISTFSAAFIIINKEIQHCRNIDYVIRLINEIKNKSLYYEQPFSEILHELHENKNYGEFVLINIFCDDISDDIAVPEAWKCAVEKISKYFTSDECNLLKQYGEEMCCCNKEEISEISDCAMYEFQQFRQIAVERRNIKSRATAAVTISAGLMIVIMLA